MKERKRISLNLMPELKDFVDEQAASKGRSTNQYIVELIEADKKKVKK